MIQLPHDSGKVEIGQWRAGPKLAHNVRCRTCGGHCAQDHALYCDHGLHLCCAWYGTRCCKPTDKHEGTSRTLHRQVAGTRTPRAGIHPAVPRTFKSQPRYRLSHTASRQSSYMSSLYVGRPSNLPHWEPPSSKELGDTVKGNSRVSLV